MGHSSICVTHLVRQQNAVDLFRKFLGSYKRHEAGVDHQLLIVFKGFADGKQLDEYHTLLSDLPYLSLRVDDVGFDIGAYFQAAQAFESQYFCFLNSYSEILDTGWLGKMYKHIQSEGTGIVGASGSYESAFSNLLRALRPRRQAFQFWKRNMVRFTESGGPSLSHRIYFPPFPNYHVRTNAFMLARDLFLKLKADELRTKMDVYQFESGRKSLTRQIFGMNLRALVVGRDGQAYDKPDWRESRTFRSGEQENLLVADNQTRQYAQADAQTRSTLVKNTWGVE